MTPQQFRDTRKDLGLSINQMAAALGLKSSRTIRRIEAGDTEITGPVKTLMQIYGHCSDDARIQIMLSRQAMDK